MDKYEYRVKTEQLLEYAEKKQYQKAMEVADTIDWRRVKSASMLNTVSEVYEYCGEYQKSRDILFVAYDRAPESRKIVYRLGTLALKINDTDEAADCYEEFVKIAPRDPNQYILKYKILKAQRAPLPDQIAALEEFKKAEYIEKWAYELAKLYHEAGMTKECLEECDDLILWFSEGKYVQLAMELKMKYKPLTPLQQEKYEGRQKALDVSDEGSVSWDIENAPQAGSSVAEGGAREEEEKDTDSEETAPEGAAEVLPGTMPEAEGEEETPGEGEIPAEDEIPEDIHLMADSIPQTETQKIRLAEDVLGKVFDGTNGNAGNEPEEDETPLTEDEIVETILQKPQSSIVKQVVTGATLEEALKSTAAWMHQEGKDLAARDEQLRIGGQMKLDEILSEWEEKQKDHAEAIEKQKAEDEARLQKEREEAHRRMEEERRAVEEVARKAAQEEAARKAKEEAQKKAAEEEAARKAKEEAQKKAAEEEAARKAKEEAQKKAAEEEAARKAEEEAARKAKEEAQKKAAEEEAARKAAEKEAVEANLKVSEKSKRKAAKEAKAAKTAKAKDPAPDKGASGGEGGNILEQKTQRLPDDIMALVEQLENRVASTKVPIHRILDNEEPEENPEEDFEDLGEESVLDADAKEEDFVETEFDGERLQDAGVEGGGDKKDSEGDAAQEDSEGDFQEDFEEDFVEEDSGEEESEEDFVEEGSVEEESEEDFVEEDFEEDFIEEDSEEEDFEEEDFEEEDFEEEDFEEEDFEEEDFEEEDFEEEDFEEEDFEEEDFEEEDFEEEDFEEEDFEEAKLPGKKSPQRTSTQRRPAKEVPIEIEEPSEEEIQKRFKKAKGGGVPFDTGFVVTGRYDLSATSEIGLKVGLTEEQKKLFSYFVPVRGMSEQIVEVLDNDRREKREGTSKTGNLLVIGRKGSGKTVLAVDIVKAIQKQRNLKQGKVAIVTGDSLNKKELGNIIQKLRGGAIIVEKAGKLNTRTIRELNQLMERKTGEMLFVLEDQRKPLERILTANPEFKRKFTSRLELPVFVNDELVTFGQTYAKENGYKLDEMGILALYSRIDVLQREDHAVSVAEVKEIMDEAIEHSQKANVKHLARKMFGKGTDEADRVILKEEDFKV